MSDLVKRLRDCGSGIDVIRCQDKTDKSYCIQFEGWDQHSADEWWAKNKDREYYKNYEMAKVRVHSQKDRLMLKAAEMLVFFFGQMQIHSPKMDGQHSYTFRSSGWPMTHCKGPNAMEAIQAAMAEIERSKAESREAGEWDKAAADEAETK
jgi:hypothetical protein